MDKAKIESIKRHDLLIISLAGRNQIRQTLAERLPATELYLADILVTELDNHRTVPLIARRADEYAGDKIPCGLVHPELVAGRRWRQACFVEAEQLERLLTPYQIWQLPIGIRNKALQTLAELKSIAGNMHLTVGLLGSLALEAYTGLSYSNERSDIDLIIKAAAAEQIQEFLVRATELAARRQIKIDLEIELTNGYGVKAPELFMDTKTILAKGKYDVVLLKRADVLSCLI